MPSANHLDNHIHNKETSTNTFYNEEKVGFLGDSPQQAYVHKLDLFNHFAAPELRQLIAELGLSAGDSILDAGCGTGLVTTWLAEQVAPRGQAVGLDLSTGHIQRASFHKQEANSEASFVQADMVRVPLADQFFDWVWVSNALNHLHQPVAGVQALAAKLRPGGSLVLGQGLFVPEMFFAWDARLEKEVMLANRQYYRDKYNLDERDTTAVRNLVGWLKAAGLQEVRAKTIVIERVAPLTTAEETYFLEAVFKGYWGHRVRPYLSEADWHTLEQLCDPASPDYCLRRPDFHHIQTYTVVRGVVNKNLSSK